MPPVKSILKPVFGPTLRFKTKAFPTPFHLQYLGKTHDSFLFSDGVHWLPCSVGKSYLSSFQKGSFKPFTVFSVFEVSRAPVVPFKVTLSNLMVSSPDCQLGCKIGNPKIF